MCEEKNTTGYLHENTAWSEYIRLVQIRKLLKEGKLEQAKEMCEQQTNAALGHLHENEAWRQEYLELWSHQRPPPFRVGFDDYDFDSKPLSCYAVLIFSPKALFLYMILLTALCLALVTAPLLHRL